MKKTWIAFLLFGAVLLTACTAGSGVTTLLPASDNGFFQDGTANASSVVSTVPEPSTDTGGSFFSETAELPTPPPSLPPIPTPSQMSTSVPTPTPTLSPTPSICPSIEERPALDTALLQASDVFVYSVGKEQVFFQKGGEKTVWPASTTKLATILYAKTLLSLDEEICPGNELELVRKGASIALFTSEYLLTAEQVIAGMLVPSGCDAAVILAAAAGYRLKPDCADGKEAVAVFVAGLNDYCRSLGMTGTCFLNPEGYPVKGHYSTLEDMLILTRLAYRDETILKYAAMPQLELTFKSGQRLIWGNRNRCVKPEDPFYIPEVTGLKTGTAYVNYACILLSMNIHGEEYLIGIFGAPQSDARYTDAISIAEWLRG